MLIFVNNILFRNNLNLVKLLRTHIKCTSGGPQVLSTQSTPFLLKVKQEKASAKKSILVEDKCGCVNLINENYFEQIFGEKVEKLWKYKYMKKDCILVQFQNEISQQKIDSQNAIGVSEVSFPIKSRMFVLNSFVGKINQENQEKNNETRKNEDLIKLSPRNEDVDTYSANELKRLFQSNAELLKFLLQEKNLTELEMKLRFFMIIQLEQFLCSGIYNCFCILPFGSSFAGLEMASSDLDLVLLPTNSIPSKHGIIFAGREMREDRYEWQRNLEIIGDIIQHLTPNFSKVARILRARIPILKFKFDLAPIDVDLSIEVSRNSGHHGVAMASYLSLCNQCHQHVRDLIVLIRIWAKQHGITKPSPGNWFTNFQLTMLVIHFFQLRKIVPPMSSVLNKKTIDLPQVDYQQDFLHVLEEFLIFLFKYEFNKKAMSIYHGKSIPKPDFAPCYIENPIEKQLNICKNIVSSELDKLLFTAYSSYKIISSSDYHLADLIDIQQSKKLNKSNFRIKADRLLSDL